MPSDETAAGDPMASIQSYIEMVARDRTLAEAREIERACEAALTGGTCGVFIRRTVLGRLVSAEPNSMVPYGQIYESRTDAD